jgi:hypothetical protein
MDRLSLGTVHRMPGLLAGKGVYAVAAVAALAVGAGGTAIALGPSHRETHVVSMPLDGREPADRAVLEIASGTAVLHVSVARLPGTLLRVSTPDDAPVRPELSGDAPVVLSLHADGGDHHAPYSVSVVLSSSVLWGLDFAGGTQRTTADLRGGKVAGITVTAGLGTLALALPRPAGTLPIVLEGGATEVLISLPGDVPARVTAGGGAARVTLDGQSRTGVPGGTVFMSPGWAAGTSRLDFDATAGFSRLDITRYPAGA